MMSPIATYKRYPVAISLTVIVVVAVIVAALGISVTQSRIAGFMLSGADSPSFAQLLQSVLDGNGLVSTIPPPNVAQHWFGVHFSPILYALVPIYALFPSILTLNILHSVLICFAAVPLYLLLCKLVPAPIYALGGALLYLLNPFVINAAAWDFHEIAFAPLLMVGLLWAALEKRRALFILCCVLLICTKEHYGLAVVGAGVLWWRQQGDMRFGGLAIAAGLISLVLIITIVMPHFSQGHSAAMLGDDPALDRYSWLVSTQGWRLLPSLIASDLSFALMLFGGVLFAAFGRPYWLLPAIADLGAIMLSSNSIMRSPNSYHASPMIAVIIIAAFYYIYAQPRPWKNIWLKGCLFVTATFAAIYLPYPISKHHDLWEVEKIHWRIPADITAEFERIDLVIPPHEPISVQTVLMPYFAPSREMYSFPHRFEHVRWVVQRLDFDLQHKLHIASMPFNAHILDYIAATDVLINDPAWQPVYAEDKIVVWHKGGESDLASEYVARIIAWRAQTIEDYCAVSHKNKVFEPPCDTSK